jgi:hypothetical protein
MPTYEVCRGEAQRAQQRRPNLHHLLLNLLLNRPLIESDDRRAKCLLPGYLYP